MTPDSLQSIVDRIGAAENVNVDPSLFAFVRNCVDMVDPATDKLRYLSECADNRPDLKLLDFGCGSSPHRPAIEAMGYRYTGVDLAQDTGFRGELENKQNIVYYDGAALPFADEMFDAVYSNQVFEHVTNPFESMAECSRVLKPGGSFVGAVSFLEPYHAYQTFSYTPFGFAAVANSCGLEMKKLSPDRDVLQILLRKLLLITGNATTDNFSKFPAVSSFMEKSFSKLGRAQQISLSLQFCGSFAFRFDKVQSGVEGAD